MIYLQEGLGVKVEIVEAGGNDVKNPYNRVEENIICSSNISGGYRALPNLKKLVRTSVTRDRFS